MNIKEYYYKLSKDDFNKKLKAIKEDDRTIHIFKDSTSPYFFYGTEESQKRLLSIYKYQIMFDYLLNSFNDFSKKQLIQSFLLEEIEATNKIENIFSTKHDIFYVLNNIEASGNKKEKSIANMYSMLLNNNVKINKVNDIRKVYDLLLENNLEIDDYPDGTLFRKNKVYISDGVNNIHTGFYPEDNIIKGLEEFISFYKSNKEPYLKMIISHFMLETIHPFYDGNGRIGRFLFSNYLFLETQSYSSFLISFFLNSKKSKYYKSFKEARDIHQFGCINNYVLLMLEIIEEGLAKKVNNLTSLKAKINDIKDDDRLSIKEKKIYRFIYESSMLTEYGVTNKEIMENCNVSKRTLMYALNKIRNICDINEATFSKITYHKIVL